MSLDIIFYLDDRDVLLRRDGPCEICGVRDMFGYYTMKDGKRVYICVIHEINDFYSKKQNEQK
ncbi:MAG: hypothetical protein Q8P79_02200 [Nanoarchaeota archaeon]|nr:hypothetical protein [Nanoarchaeota archaeon]